jgi:hypothetical protein
MHDPGASRREIADACFDNAGHIFRCHHPRKRMIQYVRPAWALTWGWKSSRELVTASEGKRRASSREDGVKEAWNETAGRRTDIG